MKNVTHEQAYSLLSGIDNILILSHRSPDGDAVGSMFALYHILKDMGKNVRCISDEISRPLNFVYDSDAFADFKEDYVVTVDLADTKLLMDELKEKYADKVFLCIDHHQTNVAYAENILLDSSAAAACEVIFDMMKKTGKKISLKTAEALYLGISTDTGCFRYANTTARTLAAASEIVGMGVDNGEINRRVFETKSKEYAAFEIMAMNSLKTYFNGRCALLVLTKEMFERTKVKESDTHPINALPRQIEGVLIGIVIKERDDGVYKISMRSNEPVSAAEICTQMGGGGHRLAAGCELSGSLDEVVDTVLKITEKALAEV